MGLDVVRLQVVHVIGADRGHPQPVGQIHQFRVQDALLLQPVVLQLDEEPVWTEGFEVILGNLLRRRPVAAR